MIGEIWGCQSWLTDRKVIKHTRGEHQHPRSSFSTYVGPCGQSEQVARCPAVILRGLSDQAVAIRYLSVDKHTHTCPCTHEFRRAAVLLGQWSGEQTNVPPARPNRPRSGRRLDGRGGCVSSPPSVGKVGVFNRHTHSLPPPLHRRAA